MSITKQDIKTIFLVGLGGTLEFFEFTIYALFSSYIGFHFFPNQNALNQLMATFGVYAIGYLARPCGGIVFGHLGDKYGRKYAFTLTMLLMAVSTLLIGCLPSYRSIGISAPLILVFLRLLQGFSVGGEIPGATVFTAEHIKKTRRGFAIGIVFMGITLGNTWGSLVGFFLTHWLGNEIMQAWGWRVPFLIGFIFGIFVYIIRKNITETAIFINIKQKENFPFITLMKNFPSSVLTGFLLMAVSSTIIAFFLYLPAYLSTFMQYQMKQSFMMTLLAFLILSLMTAISGYLSDYVGRKRLILIGCIIMLIANYVAFKQFLAPNDMSLFVFIIILSGAAGIVNGCYALMIAENFDAKVRYSGMGISYSLGVALFGGLAPLLFTFLVKEFHNVKAPCYYIFICILLTMIAALRSIPHPSLRQDVN